MIIMSNRTLVDEIITLIHSEANNNPPPKSCKIIKNYGDKPFSDVEVEDLGTLLYRKTIGTTQIGSEGIICFLNGDLNQGIVITSNPSEISDLNLDLSDLDVDFNLTFGVSGRDDIISVETILKRK